MATNCNIVRNKKGKIAKVLDSKNEKIESKLFKDLAALPHTESLEDATDMYYAALGSRKETPKDEKVNLTLSESKDITAKVLEDKITLKRLPKGAEKGRVTAGEIAVTSSIIVENHNKNNPNTDKIRGQENALIEYAKEEGILFESNHKFEGEVRSGSEAKVYLNGDKVTKVVNPYISTESAQEFLDRVAISNALFPNSAVKVIGFQIVNGRLNFVVEQDFIESEVVPTDAQLNEFFDKKGMSNDIGVFFNDNYTVEDARNDNTRINEDGEIFVIDAVTMLNTSEDTEFEGETEYGELYSKEDSPMKEGEFTSEPGFHIESDGVIYDTYKEALDNTSSPTIEIVSNGVVIRVIPSTLDESTTAGVINTFISDGVLSDKKVIFDGDTYYQTEGDSFTTRKITAEFFKGEAKILLSRSQYSVENDLVKIEPKVDHKLDKGSMREAISNVLQNYFSAKTIVAKKENINKQNLKLNLMNILTDMGVSVVSLKAYKEKYETKNKKVDPSAVALADIANRVIAFKDGHLTVENLTEEVMHLIVETLPQAEIESLMETIRNTQEYKDQYDTYLKVYKGNVALAEKEILGKVLKNMTLDKIEDTTLFSKLVEVLRSFFKSLTLNQSHRDDLRRLNKIVESLVLQENREVFTDESLAVSKEIAMMYSLGETVAAAKAPFLNVFSKITEQRHLKSHLKDLKRSDFDNLSGSSLDVAIYDYIEKSSVLIDTTKSALKRAELDNKALSGQNKVILDDLNNQISAVLKSLASNISGELTNMPNATTEEIRGKRILRDLLTDNVAIIDKLSANNKSMSNDSIKTMKDKLVRMFGLEEQEFVSQALEETLKGEVKDVNQLFSYFGQLHHASNPLLNLLQGRLWEMYAEGNQNTKADVSSFLNFLDKNPAIKDRVAELYNHDKGFMEDRVDHASFEAALALQEMQAFEKYSGESFKKSKDFKVSERYNLGLIAEGLGLKNTKTLEEDLLRLETYNDLKIKGELPDLTEEDQGNFQVDLKERQLSITEGPVNQDYYTTLFEKYETLNISGVTKAFLIEMSSIRGSIKAEATTDGRLILNSEQVDTLEKVSKERNLKKSIYASSTIRKAGLDLSLKEPAGDSVQLPTGQFLSLNLENLSELEIEKAKLSYDLHVLDAQYLKDVKDDIDVDIREGGITNFIDYVEEMRNNSSFTNKELIRTVLANIKVHLSEEFYNTMEGESFLKGDTLNKLNPENLDVVEAIKEAYAKRSAVLAKHRNSSSPFEIDRMTETEQDIIKNLSSQISDAMTVLTLPEGDAMDSAGVKSPNKEYFTKLKEDGYREGTVGELSFLIDKGHINGSHLGKIETAFRNYKLGIGLSDFQTSLMNKYLGADLLETKLNYAKANLHSYYTRFTPENYKSIEERIEAGENVADVLVDFGQNKFVALKVDPSFEDGGASIKNGNHRDDYQGGYKQPKKGKFLNKKHIDKFGLDSDGNATKEKDLFEARRLLIEARQKGLDKMGEKGYNVFKAIQISATRTEKGRKLMADKGKLTTAKDWFKDTFSYRVDDIAYGEENYQANRNLPKYFLRNLEERSDVSTDYIYALVSFSDKANEYASKKNAMSDIDALQDALVFAEGMSKNVKLKNTMQMVNSYIDQNIFGNIESKPFKIPIPGRTTPLDVTKLVRQITKFTSLKNLGFNAVIPATSLLTAGIQKRVEEIIGEKLNRDAARLASAEYYKLMGTASKNALDFNDNSKLYLIGQAFGIYDISEKSRNAKYSKGQKLFSRSAMGAHSIANFPITPKIALSILYDNRVVDKGSKNARVLTRQQYFQEGLRAGKTKEGLAVTWASLEEDTMYKYMDFTENGIKWIDNTVAETGLSLDYLEERKNSIQMQIGENVSNIEGQIPQGFKIQAQRHALLSTTLLHKSFLAVAGSKRFKDKHFNIASGMVEEGTWRTAAKLFGELFSADVSGLEMKKRVQAMRDSLKPPTRPIESDFSSKEKYDEAMKDYRNAVLDAELRVRNARRLGIEVGSYLSLALIFGSAMLLMGDDDDDSWITATSNLLMMRTLNESATNLSFNIAGDIGGVISSPIVIWDSALKVMPVWEALNGDEIQNGKYKGVSKSNRYFMNIVPGMKSMYDLHSAKTVHDTRKAYENYQKGTVLNISTFGIMPFMDSLHED